MKALLVPYVPLLATTKACGCILNTEPSLLSQKMRAIANFNRKDYYFQST